MFSGDSDFPWWVDSLPGPAVLTLKGRDIVCNVLILRTGQRQFILLTRSKKVMCTFLVLPGKQEIKNQQEGRGPSSMASKATNPYVDT